MSGFPTVNESNDFETRIAVCAAVLDISGGNCPCDVNLTLSRIDERTLRVTFSQAVELNPYLTAPINYRVFDEALVAPDLIIYSIAAEAVAQPTFIDLTTDEQRTGITYRVLAYILERA